MHRRDFLQAAMATAALTAVAPVDAVEPAPASRPMIADVNGQHLFYSVQGSGKPLVLLHGGIDPDSFGDNLAKLAMQRQVIAVHLRGHGRTPDSDAPLRCETMADDIAALIRHLKLGKADVMGYSLGAGVALLTAIRHPEAVDRLVLVSTTLRMDGFYPEGVAAFEQLEAKAAEYGPAVKASPLGQKYPDVDWTRLFRKTAEMSRQPYDLGADVVKLQARTLLVFADADAIRPEHMIEFWKALGGGQRDAGVDGALRPKNQLAVVPGATHYNLAMDPLLPEVVRRFLAAA